MSDEPPEFSIGSIQSEFLRITVRARERPDADDYWDGNWLNTTIEVAVGGFRGRYEASLRTDEFEGLRSQLAPLRENLRGNADSASMEDWLHVRIEGDGPGHFEAACEAQDKPGTGNRLRLRLSFDQTELPAMLSQLDRIIERFPVRG